MSSNGTAQRSPRNITDEDGILDISTWYRNDLQYRNPRRNSQGGLGVFTNLEGKPWPGNVIVQPPAMRCPFGVSKGMNDDGKGVDRYSVEGSFDDVETNEEIRKYKEFIEDYDDTIIDGASSNCEKWFGKKIPRDAIAELIRRNVRKSKNPQYADTVRFRVPYSNGRFTAKLYDLDENEISWDRCGSNSVIIPLTTSKSIWFVNKMFGTTWEVDHAVLVKEGGMSGGFTKCAVKIPQSLKRGREEDNGESPSKRGREEDESAGGYENID